MKKQKFIEAQEERTYKANLHSFMAEINKKPRESERQQMKEEYLRLRGK